MKKKLGPMIGMLAMMFVGGFVGFMTAKTGMFDDGFENGLKGYIVLVASLVVVSYLQIMIHEGGHLICGLLSGYRFVSYRIGSLMVVKQGGSLKFRRMSLAGTGGQCLLDPPELVDGKMPVMLYNAGGFLMNTLVSAAAAIPYILAPDMPKFLRLFLITFISIGLIFALTNGIPLRMGTVDNDGYNMVHLGKDLNAVRAFWLQMRMNAVLTEGTRLKEMPEEWFALPEDADHHNVLISTIDVMKENLLMDRHDFDGVLSQIEYLESDACTVLGLYESLLAIDKITVGLIRKGHAEEPADFTEELALLESKNLQKFMKSMKDFPTVLRVKYLAEKYAKNNVAHAEKIREHFEKVAKSYPTPADIAMEREIMGL